MDCTHSRVIKTLTSSQSSQSREQELNAAKDEDIPTADTSENVEQPQVRAESPRDMLFRQDSYDALFKGNPIRASLPLLISYVELNVQKVLVPETLVNCIYGKRKQPLRDLEGWYAFLLVAGVVEDQPVQYLILKSMRFTKPSEEDIKKGKKGHFESEHGALGRQDRLPNYNDTFRIMCGGEIRIQKGDDASPIFSWNLKSRYASEGTPFDYKQNTYEEFTAKLAQLWMPGKYQGKMPTKFSTTILAESKASSSIVCNEPYNQSQEYKPVCGKRTAGPNLSFSVISPPPPKVATCEKNFDGDKVFKVMPK